MAKSSSEQIEQDENKLLSELEKNAIENIETIAKRCGFSRQKTWRMMKQLEAKKMIWGYTAIIDEEMQDMIHFIMLIKRSTKPLDKKIVDKIDSMQLEDIALPLGLNIESSCFVHGNYDWIISFTAKDIKQAKNFCDILCNGFPGIIEHIDLMQTLYFVRKQNIFNPDRKKLRELM